MNARQARTLADRLEPATRRAFLMAVEQLKGAPLRALETAISAGDVAEVVRVLGLSEASFLPLEEAIRRSYIESGTMTIAGLNQPPGRRLTIQFGTRNPFAEQYLGTISSRKVTEIVQDTRQAIRVTMEAGQALGQGPRTTALDLVGRMVDGRRQGGVIGLTSQQAGYVANMKAELSLASDLVAREKARLLTIPKWQQASASALDAKAKQNVLGAYFTRQRRDARFDRIVRQAMESGKPVATADINRIAQRYHDRLLQLRGETIARTETMQALNTGSQDALRLVKQQEGLTDSQIRRIWRTASDERVRDSHVAMNGESVGLEEQFSIGVNYPADPNGAPEEVINCRCFAESRIDWLANMPPDNEVATQPQPTQPPAQQAEPVEIITFSDVFAGKTSEEIQKVAPAFAKSDVARLEVIRMAGNLTGGVKTGKGSFYQNKNASIQMDSARTGEAYNRVMRHEYGHHIDARIEQIAMQRAGVSDADLGSSRGVSRLARDQMKADAIALERAVSGDYRNTWTGKTNPVTVGFAEKVESDRAALSSKYRAANRSGNQESVIMSDFSSRNLNYEEVRKIFPHMFSDDLSATSFRTDAARFLAAYDNNDHVQLVYRGGGTTTHATPLAGISDSIGALTNQRLGYRFGHEENYYASFRRHDRETNASYARINPLGDNPMPTSGKYAYGTGNNAQLWANWFESYTSGSETEYSIFKKFFPATSSKFEEIIERFVSSETI